MIWVAPKPVITRQSGNLEAVSPDGICPGALAGMIDEGDAKPRALLGQQPALLELGEVEGGAGDRLSRAIDRPRMAADDDDRVDRRAGYGQFAAGERQFMNYRALARIVAALFERLEQDFGIEAFSLHMDPAAEMILGPEMSIIGREGSQAAAFGEHLIEQIPAVAAVAVDGTAVIVDLDRVRDIDGMAVLDRELRPGW